MMATINQSLVNKLKPKKNEYDVRDKELKGFLVRVQKTGNSSYVLVYYNQLGKSKRYKIASTKDITAAKARKLASELKLMIAGRRDPVEERIAAKAEAEKRKCNILSVFLKEKYSSYLKTHHSDFETSVKRFSRFLKLWGHIPLDQINLTKLQDYQRERKINGTAAATINRELVALQGLFRFAVEQGYLNESPFRFLKALKIDRTPKTRYLSLIEQDCLLDALEKRQKKHKSKRKTYNQWRKNRKLEPLTDLSEFRFTDYLLPIVQLAMKTGLRRSELLSIRWSDIDFEANQLNVSGINTKNAQSRMVPLNESAIEILIHWKSYRDYHPINSHIVFPNEHTGAKMTEIGSSWNRVLEEASISDFRFHDLRHTFASRLAAKGVDLNKIRELLGHADIATTLRYAHLSPNHLKAAVEGL